MLATFILSRPCTRSSFRPYLRRLSTRKITTSSSSSTSSAFSKTFIASPPKPSTAPVSFWRRRSEQDEEKELKGMSNLLVHTPARGRGLVRRPVSFKQAVRVTLSIKLDGSAIVLNTEDDNDIIQIIQNMSQKYQEYMHQITLLLTYLQRHDATIAVQLQKNTLRINLPDSLFIPDPPSKTRANAWLRRIGIHPDSPGFEIREEQYTSTTKTEPTIIGPGYFRDIQLFLDQVDHLIESSMAFNSIPRKVLS